MNHADAPTPEPRISAVAERAPIDAKKTYATPHVEVYGDVRTLTGGTSPGSSSTLFPSSSFS